MKEPSFGEKRWIRTKGSKNCVKIWSYTYTDDEGNHHGEWLICPMKIGVEMTWQTKKFKIKDTHSSYTLKSEPNFISILRKNNSI